MRTEQPASRGSLGAAASGTNSDITSLTGLTSIVGTTAVKLHFISSIENLSTATASTGEVHLETTLLP